MHKTLFMKFHSFIYRLKLIGLIVLIQFTYGISIIRQPENTTVIESQSTQLECVFNTQVYCVWLRNGLHVDIYERYNYKSGNGQSTYDCSLIIRPVNKNDNGTWQCMSMTDSDGNPSLTSQILWLNVQEIKLMISPTGVSAVESEAVELRCVFNTPVDCMWIKDGRNISITGNHIYKARNGAELTDDCSIAIDPIEIEDAGQFHCASTELDIIPSVTSKRIRLNVEAMKIVTQPQSQNVVNEGANVTLLCEFNANVNCNWTRNGHRIQDGYHYIDKSISEDGGRDTKSCSILMLNVKKNAHDSKWICSNTLSDKISKIIPSRMAEIVIIDMSSTTATKPESNIKEVEKPKQSLFNGLFVTIAVIAVIVLIIATILIYKFQMTMKHKKWSWLGYQSSEETMPLTRRLAYGDQIPNSTLKSDGTYHKWKINGIDSMKKKLINSELESKVFELKKYSLKAQTKLKLDTSTEKLSISIKFIDQNKEGKMVELNEFPAVVFILKDLSGGSRHILRTYSVYFGRKIKFNMYNEWKYLCDKSLFNNTTYVKDDSIQIDIYVESPDRAQHHISNNGQVEWKINEYDQKKQNERNGLDDGFRSPYFCTSLDGYRVQVKLWLNGRVGFKGKGLTAEIRFLRGKNDTILSDQFPHQTTIIVCNQLGMDKDYTKMTSNNLASFYLIDLLQHDTISSKGFLKDNSLVLTIIIKPQ